ncbi:MAG TPA: PIN domain-containing protein [Acidimicrobiales bacterium]|nr:PIN domain-containing protein [Acidimicrobiales bacterium]
MARFSVVFDACVLVPIALTDTLLRIGERGLYRPLWSARIVTEAIDAIAEIHPGLDVGLVRRRFAIMDEVFEDARVDGWEALEATVALPDPDDRHVLAVALRGRADAIITANTRDFPPEVVGPLNIEIIDPDSFLLDQLDLAPRIVLEVLREQSAHTRRPALSPVDLLARLARAGAPTFAQEAGRLI